MNSVLNIVPQQLEFVFRNGWEYRCLVRSVSATNLRSACTPLIGFSTTSRCGKKIANCSSAAWLLWLTHGFVGETGTGVLLVVHSTAESDCCSWYDTWVILVTEDRVAVKDSRKDWFLYFKNTYQCVCIYLFTYLLLSYLVTYYNKLMHCLISIKKINDRKINPKLSCGELQKEQENPQI